MIEWIKSGVLVGLAVVLAIAAYWMQPSPPETVTNTLVGKNMFPDFDDPAKAESMKITKYNAELAEIQDFEVAQKNGKWVLPSQSDYPADAPDGLQNAAAAIVDLKVIDIASESPQEHELYGVVEPNVDKLKAGEKGVGTLVQFAGASGRKLAELIVGGKVKDRDGLRFVRIPGQDVVMLANFNLDDLSTKFSDWIKTDLLDFKGIDLADITIKDYSVIPLLVNNRPVNQLAYKSEMTFEATPDSKWSLEEFKAGKGDKLESAVLLDDEEVNDERLNELKTALGDFKIVDVRRKSEGLSADLKGNVQVDEDFLRDREALQALNQIGIIPVANQAEQRYELKATSGELVVGMKEGYEYVIRFGRESGLEEGSDTLNRFVFVMARLRDDHFPKPTLKPLPELPTADGPPSPDGKIDPELEDKIAEVKALQEEIKKENQRSLDQWNDEKSAATLRVRDLNEKFADWFFVIGEEEFKKVHLSQDELLKRAPGTAEAGSGVDAFRELENTPLEK